MNARYYTGVGGMFVSQDPLYLDIGEPKNAKLWQGNLSDPQQLNSYAYARNNPLYYIDPLGLWNKETGAVEKGDTLGGITSQINNLK